MLKFDTYEDLFTYKIEFTHGIKQCIFIDKIFKIYYDGKQNNLFIDYEFYIQILKNLTEILNITNKFIIFLPVPNYYGICIEKKDDLIIGTIKSGYILNDPILLLNNLPEINVLNIALEDVEKLKYLTNPPVTIQEINIVHRIDNYKRTIDDFIHLFNKIPFGCSINLKYIL
jgi:hypothetical protein